MATENSNIDKMIDNAIGREGGYSNHPADRGGPTRWGITEQVARAYGYSGDMRILPRETAIVIYERLYWHRPGFDLVSRRYPALAEKLFDLGINMGPSVGATFLQRCLNAFNDGAKHYPDIRVDGQLGPISLFTLDSYRQRRGAEGGVVLLSAVSSLQGARYIDITEGRSANEAFTYGWFRRLVEMGRELFK